MRRTKLEGRLSEVREAALQVARAGRSLVAAGAETRSHLLHDLASALGRPAVRAAILAANTADLGRARATPGFGAALLDRLALGEGKLPSLADGLRQLGDQADPLGRVTLRRELDEGLVLTRETCPLGVLAVVFESRPDALVQIAGLAFRSGNGLLLKGGIEARESNRALAAMVREALVGRGLDAAAVTLLEDRRDVQEVIALEGLVDLVIARGSSAFVHQVKSQSRVPVLGHGEGICHVYLHATADPAMAARIALDAKTSYPAACNAMETLLWDADGAVALDAAVSALTAAGVDMRGCTETRRRHPAMAAASEADWDTEHGSLVLGIRQVRGIEDALAHIAAHGSRHTEAIVTEDRTAAERFLAEVDAASVFHNASTRFADGYRFGLGAEVGVSTDKLHARGPVAVEGLLTYRWLLRGDGQVSTSYGTRKRPFTHRDI